MPLANDQLNQMMTQAMMGRPTAPSHDPGLVEAQLLQAMQAQTRADAFSSPRPRSQGQFGWGSALSEALRPFAAKRMSKKAQESLAEALGKKGELGRHDEAMAEYEAGIKRVQDLQDAQMKEGFKNQATSQMKNAAAMGLSPGTPEYSAQVKDSSGGITINTGNTPESAQHAANMATIKTRTQNTVARNEKLIDLGHEARRTLPNYKMGLALLDKVETGPLTESFNDIKKYASAIGLDIDMTGVANYEQLAPIFGKFLFQGIQQTKGAISNKEMDIFQKMNANYAYTTEGNRRLLKFAKAKAERDIDIGNLVRKMRGDDATAPEISDGIEKYISENDLSASLMWLVTGGIDNDDDALLSKYLD